MPNVTLTYRCNLRCPYCFAHEFVNGSAEDMTLESFDEAVAFLTQDGPTHIGLIGGEPTLHPDFGAILDRVIENPRITSVTLYTNGIKLVPYVKRLTPPKISLLVNWNSPEMLKSETFSAVRSNIDTLIFEHDMGHRLNLGINLYSASQDYEYMRELLKRYELHKVRISLTVPDFPEGCGTDVLAYFRSYKPFLLDFFRAMDDIDVLPYYDCNRPPTCIWSDDEKLWLEQYVARYNEPDSSLVSSMTSCRPVIDILPDLRAVRCFGLSFFDKVSIRDFVSLEDLRVYFMQRIDRPAYRVLAGEACENCHLRRTWQCCQGCMGFKGTAKQLVGAADLT